MLRLFSRLGKQVMRMNACSTAMIRDGERLGGFGEDGWSLSHHSQPSPSQSRLSTPAHPSPACLSPIAKMHG